MDCTARVDLVDRMGYENHDVMSVLSCAATEDRGVQCHGPSAWRDSPLQILQMYH